MYDTKHNLVENRIKLKVLGITYSQIQNGAYALVLAEEEGPHRIPIIIGTAEAQAIAIRLEHLVPPRPMTHDLFVSFAHAFGIRLVEVFIYKFEDGVFSSELLFDDGERQIRVDSRTSDAIAIALRSQAAVYITPEIVEEAGIIFDETPEEANNDDTEREDTPKKRTLKDFTIQELQEQLEKAIDDEAYEIAAQIQQEINRRNENPGRC